MLANVNENTIAMSVTSSSSASLVNVGSKPNVMVYNAGTVPVFVKTGGSSVTAVFPTSTAQEGTVVAPGAIMSMSKSLEHTYLAAITSSGTATIYVQFSGGE